MPYIGNTPALDYISYAVQNFTVTAGTTVYTLDYSVANENDIRLVINNVIQRPGASYAYSATGTTLTLTSATLSTDTMYAVFIGRAVQTVTPPANSITNTMLAPSVITGQTAETSVAGGDLVLIYDDSATALRKMTRTNFVAGIGGTNTPAFGASLQAGDQTISDGVTAKVIFSNEIVDTNNAYDATTNYRFTVPTGQGGIYLFSACFWLYDASASITEGGILLYKNGSQLITINTGDDMQRLGLNFTVIDNASVGDYYEVYAFGDTSDSGNVLVAGSGSTSNYRSFFTGFKIIE